MIDRHAVVTWIPGIVDQARNRLRTPRASQTIAAHAASTPWDWQDLGRVLLWTACLTLGGIVGLFVCRILISLFFLVGEAVGLIHQGSFAHLDVLLAPYSTALTTLLMGGLFCCSLLYGVYRCSIVKYRQPWSSLGFRVLDRRTTLSVAALLVPAALGGLLVTRLEAVVLGRSLHNPEAGFLTRGMPLTSANILLLALLVVIIVPLAEEIFFRGFLYRMLRGRLSLWGAAAGSAAPYAALHGVADLFPWLFFMGIVYAVIVERTRSLYSGLLLHMMVNSLALLGMILSLSGS